MQPSPARILLGFAVGFLGPILVAWSFAAGHAAIDQPEPDTAVGGRWYLATVVLAVAMAASLWLLLDGPVLPQALWGLLVVFPAYIVAGMYGGGYNGENGFAYPFMAVGTALYVGTLFLVTIVLAAAQLGRQAGYGMVPVLVGGVGLSLGIMAAALYFLATLDAQAERARAAHRSPALEAVAALAVALCAAAWLRKRS